MLIYVLAFLQLLDKIVPAMRDPDGEIARRAADALRRGALSYPMSGALPLPGAATAAAAAAEPSIRAAASIYDYGAASAGGGRIQTAPPSPAISEVQESQPGAVSIYPIHSEAVEASMGSGANGVQPELDSNREKQSAAEPVQGLGLCELVDGLAAGSEAGAAAERSAKGRKEKKEKKERHRERAAARSEGTGRAAGQGSDLGATAAQVVALSEAPGSRPVSAGGPHKITLKLRTRGAALP